MLKTRRSPEATRDGAIDMSPPHQRRLVTLPEACGSGAIPARLPTHEDSPITRRPGAPVVLGASPTDSRLAELPEARGFRCAFRESPTPYREDLHPMNRLTHLFRFGSSN